MTLRCLCFIAFSSEQFVNLQYDSVKYESEETAKHSVRQYQCDRFSTCRIVLTALSNMTQVDPEAL
jgi:hypothetical protein